MSIAQQGSDMLDIGIKVFSVICDIRNIFNSHRIRCFHCGMALGESLYWVLTAQPIAFPRSDCTVGTPL